MKAHALQRQFAFWTLLLVVVPSIITMTIYTVGQIEIARHYILEMIQQRVVAQERLIDYWMTERVNDVRVLSQSEAFRALDNANMKKALSTAQAANPNFDSLSYIDKDGSFRLSTLPEGIAFPSAQGQLYYREAQSGNEYISDAVIGRNSRRQIINFSSPVYDFDGSFQGLILGSVRTATLETLLRDNQIGHTGSLYLINSKGIMLTEPSRLELLKEKGLVEDTAKMKLKISDDALHSIALSKTGTATWVDHLGNRVMGAYLYVPERDWTIIGQIDEAEILGPIYWQLAIMAGATIVIVLLILPLAARIARRFKQPIDWLIAQAEQVKRENYALVGQEQCLPNVPHELATLCNTFIDMSRKIGATVLLLKEHEDELKTKFVEIQDINAALEEEIAERQSAQAALQQLNTELETRVLQRTSDLKELNTKLHGINEALTVSEAHYRALFIHMQNAFNLRKVVVDSEGRPMDLEYIEVNPAYEHIYGRRAADIVGRRMTEVFPGVDKEPFRWVEVLGTVALTGYPVNIEEYFLSGDKWIRLDAYSPEPGFVASVLQDITESKLREQQLKQYSEELRASNIKLRELNEELRRTSLSDGLTGIANRRYFDEYLERELQRAKREKKPLALLMLDVDFFKAYNDTYGHIAGDECLQQIANLLKALPKRASDLVARYGGEEFAIVMPDTDERGAAKVGEKVRAGVKKLKIEHKTSSIGEHVTVSVGVVVAVPEQDSMAPRMIAAADQALYQAKHGGRNQVIVAPKLC